MDALSFGLNTSPDTPSVLLRTADFRYTLGRHHNVRVISHDGATSPHHVTNTADDHFPPSTTEYTLDTVCSREGNASTSKSLTGANAARSLPAATLLSPFATPLNTPGLPGHQDLDIDNKRARRLILRGQGGPSWGRRNN